MYLAPVFESALEKPRRQRDPDYVPQGEEGNVIDEPSDDELLPLVPEELCLPQRHFPALGPTWNALPNPTAPRRDPQSFPPTGPDAEVPRVDGDSYEKGDLDFSRRYTLTPPSSYVITVTTEQLKRAGEEPNRGWPAYSALYPEGNPAEVTHDPVFVRRTSLIWGPLIVGYQKKQWIPLPLPSRLPRL